MQRLNPSWISVLLLVSLSARGESPPTADMASQPASEHTIAAQAQMRATLPSDNGQDEDFAHRGFVATRKDPLIRRQDGQVVWDIGQLDWVKGDAPPTVNPSLWRHTKLLAVHGLFKVADGVWQVRGLDAANMMIVSGKTGWIIIDPLMTTETASAALALVNEQLGKRPVSAILYGHSHPDHFGGARAVITPGTNPPIFAPAQLVKEAASEYVLAGNAMNRRAAYQFGISLPPGPQGYVGSGIVEAAAMGGTVTLVPPTDSIEHTGDSRVIDGVKFEFQMVPETEAPAEINFYLPAQHTLYVSEDATCTMHNVQTPRGALVRDANKWAGYLTEAIELYGSDVDALVTGHCWPRFGNAVIRNYLALQRDNYKFIHDQTVRLMNRGKTPTEIAETLQLPPAIANEWSNRGYYGTVRHNAKGVYQRYIGWWDGIPAHLDLYPPIESARRYVNAMGGAKSVLHQARTAMADGDYRWSAQLLNDLVFVEPKNRTARALLADSYEQMGYQTESAIWRNIYLTGAAELRGAATSHIGVTSADIVAAIPTDAFLDLIASRLNPQAIGDRSLTMTVDETDRGTQCLLALHNAVLVSEVGKSIDSPTVSVSGSRMQLMGLFIRKQPLETLEAAGLKVSGDRNALTALLKAIEPPPADYPIIEP